MLDTSLSENNLASLATEILTNGHTLRFRARGGSMRPFIRAGDILEIQPWSGETLRRGDVILYIYQDNRLMVHRIVRMAFENGSEVITTQGDAFLYPDDPVFPARVLGYVTAIEREGRHIQIDKGFLRRMALFWLALSPYSQRIFQWLVKIKARLHDPGGKP
jgi:signal peptidase